MQGRRDARLGGEEEEGKSLRGRERSIEEVKRQKRVATVERKRPARKRRAEEISETDEILRKKRPTVAEREIFQIVCEV